VAVEGVHPRHAGLLAGERPLTDEWIATSDAGRFKIRGRNQAELNARRWALWSQVIADCRAAIAELFPGDP
jgi:hypothetical protein